VSTRGSGQPRRRGREKQVLRRRWISKKTQRGARPFRRRIRGGCCGAKTTAGEQLGNTPKNTLCRLVGLPGSGVRRPPRHRLLTSSAGPATVPSDLHARFDDVHMRAGISHRDRSERSFTCMTWATLEKSAAPTRAAVRETSGFALIGGSDRSRSGARRWPSASPLLALEQVRASPNLDPGWFHLVVYVARPMGV
jgi:hypothetical protein